MRWECRAKEANRYNPIEWQQRCEGSCHGTGWVPSKDPWAWLEAAQKLGWSVCFYAGSPISADPPYVEIEGPNVANEAEGIGEEAFFAALRAALVAQGCTLGEYHD